MPESSAVAKHRVYAALKRRKASPATPSSDQMASVAGSGTAGRSGTSGSKSTSTPERLVGFAVNNRRFVAALYEVGRILCVHGIAVQNGV